ncbi:MAG: hypothetical protein EXR78_09365 [Deltaproteobacteria bacterium]|nr:hypothetical protein [Deltaproteobacteria bacterium]
MLRIRQEQMEALSAVMRTAFVRRVVARLRTDFTSEMEKLCLHDADLTPTVERIIDKAATYSVRNEQDVELFMDCAMMLGLEFDQDPSFPWARSILQRNDLTGTEKMSLIHDYLLFATE